MPPALRMERGVRYGTEEEMKDDGDIRQGLDAANVTVQGQGIEFPYPGMPAMMIVWVGEKEEDIHQGDFVTLNAVDDPAQIRYLEHIKELPMHRKGRTYTFRRGVPTKVAEEHADVFLNHGKLQFEKVSE